MSNEKNEIEDENDEQPVKHSGWPRRSNFDCLFYSSDFLYKYIDDDDIMYAVEKQYKEFNSKTTDSVLRKTFIEMLNNENFINFILKKYSINLQDLICIIYRNYSSMFSRPSFVKNIVAAISDKSYVNSISRQQD